MFAAEPVSQAVFLDRDGVIIENVDSYVRTLSEVIFIPGALEALQRLSSSLYKIIIVTNQSAVGRGVISLAMAEEINRHVVLRITQAGGRVDGLYMCPHAPKDGCDCRKPLPGLILRAARELSIDLGRSILVGDALTDLQSGQAAGICTNMLVRTGRGQTQLGLLVDSSHPEVQVFADLGAAVERIFLTKMEAN
jgi:D-glycero-D-manno-heptose 1,7-bisphosphate phosphatase